MNFNHEREQKNACLPGIRKARWLFSFFLSFGLFTGFIGIALGADSRTDLFIHIIENNTRVRGSEQLIFVVGKDKVSFRSTVHIFEKINNSWQPVFPPFSATMGKKGFASVSRKREGDKKTPSGIFGIGTAFGYAPTIKTKMPYRQATKDDFWVDDVNSDLYNQWVRGKPNAASYEKMRRGDSVYKYGIVINYNTNPIVKGRGSAIFFHVWRSPEKPTEGCIAISEENILKLLRWLDPSKRPLVIMGAETNLLTFKGEDLDQDDLVDMTKINSHIIVDLKYASADNFIKRKLYDSNTCFLRRSTAIKLNTVQKELEKIGLGLKVWDCYRPLSVQRTLWDILPDNRYVANPQNGSRHNRASAVDLTLVDSTGKELPMPTGLDDFRPKAHRDYNNLPESVIKNRQLLEDQMTRAGFIPLANEWWHFDDKDWKQFQVINIPFKMLLPMENRGFN